jgi:pilus assembly protein TadC
MFLGAGAAAVTTVVGAPWWATVLTGAATVGLVTRLRNRPRPASVAEMRSVAATLDILAACLDAGMPVVGALAASIADRTDHDVAHDALAQTAALMMLGGDAVQAWRPVERVTILAGMAAAARRSATSGVRLAGAARETAAALRAQCRATVAADAARAGVAMTAPLALCFLPAFLCLGLAPTVLGLVASLHLW